MKKRPGFSLLEILVSIIIIGMLATVAVYSINNVRSKSRDAKRISDVRAIKTALAMYNIDHDSYPETITVGSTLIDDEGKVYMERIPFNPTPDDGQCGFTEYEYARTTDGKSYTLNFCLGGSVNSLSPNTCQATPDSVLCLADEGSQGSGVWRSGSSFDTMEMSTWLLSQAESDSKLVNNVNNILAIETAQAVPVVESDGPWVNPYKVGLSDNSYTTVSSDATYTNTDVIMITGFNFDIPTGATITGIEAQVEIKIANGEVVKNNFNLWGIKPAQAIVGVVNLAQYNTVSLIKNGASTKTASLAASNNPLDHSSDSYDSFGGAGNLWGTTWTPAEINSGNFGIAISAGVENGTAYLDHVQIRVFYN